MNSACSSITTDEMPMVDPLQAVGQPANPASPAATPRGPYRRPPGTDWPRLMLDLRIAGLSLGRIAQALGCSRSTVQGWAAGHEPRPADGERLLTLWAKHVAKDEGA